MAELKTIPEVAKARPLSPGEALSQVLRRWYVVLAIAAIGAGVSFYAKTKLRQIYRSEGTFRIRAVIAPPKQEGITLPQEDTVDPSDLGKMLLTDALKADALRALFKAHPKVFGSEVRDGDDAYLAFIRRYAKIIPKTDKLFVVHMRAFSPEQARLLVDLIAGRAIKAYADLQLGRAVAFLRFVTKQQAVATAQVDKLEAEMIAFLRSHPSLLVKAMAKDKRLQTSGPDRLRIRARRRVLARAGSKMAAKDPELRKLIDQRARLRRELKALSGDEDTPTSTGATKLAALQAARQRLSEQKARGLADTHPIIKSLRRQVRRLEAEMSALKPGQNSETTKYESRVRSQLAAVTRRISRKLKRGAGAMSASPVDEAKWAALQRSQQLLITQAEGLDKLASAARFNTKLSKEAGGALATVVLPGNRSEKPDGLPPKLVFVAGVGLSLLFGAIIALLIGMADRRIYRASEVVELLKMPLLATLHAQSSREVGVGAEINRKLLKWATEQETVEVELTLPSEPPTAGSASAGPAADLSRLALPAAAGGGMSGGGSTSMVLPGNLLTADAPQIKRTVGLRLHTVPVGPPNVAGWYLADAPSTRGADQMRLLAGRLEIMRDTPTRVVVVTSWEPGVGRSTVSGNLGLALAESRRRTIVIDACGGDRSLTRLFGLRPEDKYCLYQQLESRMSGAEDRWTLYKLAEALYVIPASVTAQAMGSMLSSVAFREMIEQLRALFDVLVIDAMPMSKTSDAVTLHQEADTVVIVARRKISTLRGAAQLVEKLDPERVEGVVFNEH